MGICTLEINVWGWICDGLATHPGEKSTLLVASCLSSRDKPQQYGRLNKVILNLSSNIHCGVNRDQAFLTWCSDICAPKGAYQHRSGLLQTCCSRVSHPQQGHEAWNNQNERILSHCDDLSSVSCDLYKIVVFFAQFPFNVIAWKTLTCRDKSPFKNAVVGPQFRSGEYPSLIHTKNSQKKNQKQRKQTSCIKYSKYLDLYNQWTVQYIAVLRTKIFTKM